MALEAMQRAQARGQGATDEHIAKMVWSAVDLLNQGDTVRMRAAEEVRMSLGLVAAIAARHLRPVEGQGGTRRLMAG